MATLFDEFWAAGGRRCAAPPLPIVKDTPSWPTAMTSAVSGCTRPLHRQLAQALYEAVDQSRHHVYVENPYFSDPRLLAKLTEARHAAPMSAWS